MVAQEKICIYIQTFYNALGCQLNYYPIMAGNPFALAFPAIHPFTPVGKFFGNKNPTAGFYKIFFFGKKIIGAIQGFTAKFFGGQVGEFRK
jgi:hypothetical protein